MTAKSTTLPTLSPEAGTTPSTTPSATPRTTPAAAPGSSAARGGARPSPRLYALDGLRLLAALSVAAYHYGGRDGEIGKAWGASPAVQFPTAHSWFAYGWAGVQAFFVISGFVICASGWGRSVQSFLASRAARLLPAYWAAVVLVTAVLALPGIAFARVSASEFLVNLTMLQMPLGADRVLGVCWTLWAEVRFYVLFALCVVLPGVTRRRVIWFCGGWTLAATLAEASGEPFLQLVLMPEYASLFIGGIGLYLVHRDRRDTAAWLIVGFSLLLSQYHTVRDMWHAPNDAFFSYRPQPAIVLAVVVGFVAVGAVALGFLDRVNWRWLTTAGALTYPFYLVHEHLGWPVVRALHQGLGLPSSLTLALTVALMLLLAWLLHHGVERPLQPRLRASLQGRRR
ncbi:acyltransferase family protein [Streptomyces neyagawaensis]|uniref:acyltransferase family protein n=1 Tax=Streptomyces neyagawaensis TaxID=42238 RepID=UPI0006E1E08C|nr:acyltransferase [Streptomyces neyagawaensis]MCL6734129.1 acyltransferase [Streptomyces neyagawaensis]MDE1681062.1 acyltransferase [Streptomyces neyagawaensis]